MEGPLSAAPDVGRGRLVIRAPNWVGDLVMATPVFAAALASARWREVHIVVRAHLAGVLADAPWAPNMRALARDADETELYRALAPDAVLLLSNSFGAAWRARRAGVRVRAGSALSRRRWLLTHVAVPPTRDGRRLPIPTAHLHRDVAGLVGLEVPDLHPRLAVRDEIVREQTERLTALGVARDGYVLCCPGAAFGAAKLWPAERFAAVLDALHARYGWRGVVTGGPGEEALVEHVARATRHGALSLAHEPRDLERLKALVRDARLLLVGDSGPRWYAAALDVPCVSVLGPNFPELTATSLEFCRVVRVEGLACSPCLERVCPLGHHRCMNELGIASVFAAALDVLGRTRTADVRASARVAQVEA